LANPVGRPPIFTSPEEIQIKINEYFELCKTEKEFPNTASLAHYLGFATRQSLYDLQEKEDFSYTIKRAILRIEGRTVDKAISTSSSGAIFVLKNMGWHDKTEQEHSGGLEVKYEIPTQKPIGAPVSFGN
jgi:hypothetical protein